MGSLRFEIFHTPGHTPACCSYKIGDNIFTGDALFMPDSGTGRCDFPGGSAEHLYHSVHEVLYKLPETTKVFVAHDYQPGGRNLAYETTIREQKAKNIHLSEDVDEKTFVALREGRDQTLSPPRLMNVSLAANLCGGT